MTLEILVYLLLIAGFLYALAKKVLETNKAVTNNYGTINNYYLGKDDSENNDSSLTNNEKILLASQLLSEVQAAPEKLRKQLKR